MSLLGTIRHAAKTSFAKMHDVVDFKPPQQDTNLPYGAHIGSLATINESAFLVASMLGSIITPPTTGEVIVRAISKVTFADWSPTLDVYRYYLNTGDSNEKERYIQVITEAGEIKEAVYFAALHRMYPDDPSVIKFYRGDDQKDSIGYREWCFTKTDLENFKVPNTKEDLVYMRAVGDDDYHPPIKGTENRIDDSEGSKGISQKIWMMPHVRVLDGDIQEHLYISLEIVEHHDDKKECEVRIDFMVGISISVNDFRII